MISLFKKYKHIISRIVGMAFRAKDAGLIKLPKKMEKGTNCGNCVYWRDTDSDRVGYCWHPEVSIFVTKRQTCNLWNADGAIDLSDRKKTQLIEDFRDQPPSATQAKIKFDALGGIKYTDPADKARAVATGVITLPKDEPGARCYNCKFSTPVGWCKNAQVNQPIEKNDCCNYWDHPGTIVNKD